MKTFRTKKGGTYIGEAMETYKHQGDKNDSCYYLTLQSLTYIVCFHHHQVVVQTFYNALPMSK